MFAATACPAVTAVTKPAAAVTGIFASGIAKPVERWISSPPELLRSIQAVPLVQRFAVQRSGRRQAGAAILRRCLCGDQVRCNGIMEAQRAEARTEKSEPMTSVAE